MKLELFQKNYTGMMMRIVNRYAEMEEQAIKEIMARGNHNQILKAKESMENLAQAKMLLNEYEGCPYCFEPDCGSDHK